MKHKYFIPAVALLGMAAPLSAQSVKAGIAAWQHSDYDTAVKNWRPLAEKGNADAQFNLAQAYRLGRGVPINLQMAESWLKRAAIQGHIDAETTLGLLQFQNGNRTLGVYWLRAAANKNDPRAMLVYGTALFNGDGVKPDPALGYAYVSRAAAQGLDAAKTTMSDMESSVPPEQRTQFLAMAANHNNNGAAKASRSATTPALTTKAAPRKTAVAPAGGAPQAPPKVASGNWRIQLGAFGQRSTAETLFRKLSSNIAIVGRSAFYLPAGSVIRLQIGPFASRATAIAACRVLAGHGQACFPVIAQ